MCISCGPSCVWRDLSAQRRPGRPLSSPRAEAKLKSVMSNALWRMRRVMSVVRWTHDNAHATTSYIDLHREKRLARNVCVLCAQYARVMRDVRAMRVMCALSAPCAWWALDGSGHDKGDWRSAVICNPSFVTASSTGTCYSPKCLIWILMNYALCPVRHDDEEVLMKSSSWLAFETTKCDELVKRNAMYWWSECEFP